jgi:hypothetical protein
MEIEVALYRGFRPRLLAAMRIRLYAGNDFLEHLLQRHTRLGHRLYQFAGKHAVGSGGTVLSALTGCRGIGDEGAAGRVHARKPALDAARLGQRIVAAGVQDHDIHLVLRRLHGTQHPAGVEGVGIQVGLGLNVGIYRDQIVRTFRLNPMPGVVEQAHRMLVTADAGAELVHCPIEIQPLGIEPDNGFEARGFQCALHCGGVVGRVGQLQVRVGVVAIADDQCNARLGGHTPGGRQQYQECAKSEAEAHTLTCAVANQMGLGASLLQKG